MISLLESTQHGEHDSWTTVGIKYTTLSLGETHIICLHTDYANVFTPVSLLYVNGGSPLQENITLTIFACSNPNFHLLNEVEILFTWRLTTVNKSLLRVEFHYRCNPATRLSQIRTGISNVVFLCTMISGERWLFLLLKLVELLTITVYAFVL
jgi:hypothetical protein